ncbi:hypothetical protein V8G54_034032 [Vigna mungo]|uniref:Uncharacterized protein n=1 Tax=Vigna mungo TaxID=3915 RepID=A0AAQ3MNZ3_VIGMU
MELFSAPLYNRESVEASTLALRMLFSLLSSSTVALSFSMAACSKDITCKVRSSMSDSSSTDERSKRMPSCMNNSSRNFTSSTLNFSVNLFKTLALESSSDGEAALELVSLFSSL